MTLNKNHLIIQCLLYFMINLLIGCSDYSNGPLIFNEFSNRSVQKNTAAKRTSQKSSGKTIFRQNTAASDPSIIAQKPDRDERNSIGAEKKVPYKTIEFGMLKPSIYFFPIINEDTSPCRSGNKKYIRNSNGEDLILVCKKTWDACNLQGSCAVIQKSVRRAFNVANKVMGENRFIELGKSECPYGFGVKNYCLDPFHSLAADLGIYKPGDVIYIPAAVGASLPDKTIHDGFFIVRDAGNGIKGKGRFDFYTGFIGWEDKSNPFKKIGLDDLKTKVPYYKISGEQAAHILQLRAYPKLPIKN